MRIVFSQKGLKAKTKLFKNDALSNKVKVILSFSGKVQDRVYLAGNSNSNYSHVKELFLNKKISWLKIYEYFVSYLCYAKLLK